MAECIRQRTSAKDGGRGRVRHLLVTNDFPPKIGGIQSYLWELWRRLPNRDVTVLTTPHPDAAAWDARQPFRIERTRERWLLPRRSLAARIDALADEIDAEIVMLDPALPLGALGPRLVRPYGVIVHGAELAVPARVPAVRRLLADVLRGARVIVAAGAWVAEVARTATSHDDDGPPVVSIPPGADTARFRPLAAPVRRQARAAFGIDPDATLILGVGRLVPRKGFDRLIRAVARIQQRRADVVLAIAGAGRDRARLAWIAHRSGAHVRLLGPVSNEMLPALHGCADVFALPCRDRWLGIEAEGFGGVFVEAAAAGVPQVAGASGGAPEAVAGGETGLVVPAPVSVADIADGVGRLVDDPALRARLGAQARARAERQFSYDRLARTLDATLEQACGGRHELKRA